MESRLRMPCYSCIVRHGVYVIFYPFSVKLIGEGNDATVGMFCLPGPKTFPPACAGEDSGLSVNVL